MLSYESVIKIQQTFRKKKGRLYIYIDYSDGIRKNFIYNFINNKIGNHILFGKDFSFYT